MKRVFVTGFDAFGGLTQNPSAGLALSLQGLTSEWQVMSVILPTIYYRSQMLVEKLFAEQPEAVVMFGFTERTDCLRIEQFAHNSDRSSAKDNEGRAGVDVIVQGAPPIYKATVDLIPIFRSLQSQSVPFSYSIDAGGYVCNHAYFVALHMSSSANLSIPCLFVHVPAMVDVDMSAEVTRGAKLIVESVVAQTA